MNFRALSTCLLALYLLAAFSAVNCQSSNENNESGSEARGDNLDRITDEVLDEVFESCQKALKERYLLEVKLSDQGRVVKTSNRKTDPSLIRQRNTDPLVHEREINHLPLELASEELYDMYNLTNDEVQRMPSVQLKSGLSERSRENCTDTTETMQCDGNARYRTANGQCNNLDNPTYGSVMSCQQRLLPPYYIVPETHCNHSTNILWGFLTVGLFTLVVLFGYTSCCIQHEGMSDFRESVRGGPLPLPRTLSLNLHYHLNRPTNYVTHMYMFFGQLLDHDITFTPVSTTIDNEAIECCPPEQETHPQCRPILISRNDPFYSRYGVTCLNFVRSAICATCYLGQRQQANQVTAFIDASFVYGNSDNETAALRENDGTGRMRTQTSNYGDLLPASPNPNEDQCSFPQTNDICFQAGDARANQHTVLTSLHTIFLREHNRLVAGLSRINPQWDDERLFQEARRILGAQMQVITYKEYLPITLGRDRMSYFQLCVGGTTRYNRQENPSMILEFTTAAFRFGHSLINSAVANSPRNASNQRRLLRDEFFQPFDLYRGFIGPLVRGASNSPAQWFDQHLVEDVTNFLFRVRGNQTGLDLASFNINRGRDHGIPPYVDMVRFCSEGEINVQSFSDLVNYNLMGYHQMDDLRRNYRDVNDIDLWPGILMETPNENAVVGPTGACVIGMQFRKLKFGDRFYFEHSNVGVRFTSKQMEELSKTTLSNIICLNTDVPSMSRNAMLFNSRNNPTTNCSYVRGIDLSCWRE